MNATKAERERESFSQLLRSERGATMLEYGILGALIAVVAIAAVTFLGFQAEVTKVNISCNMCLANSGFFAFPDNVTFCAGAASTDPDATLTAMRGLGCAG